MKTRNMSTDRIKEIVRVTMERLHESPDGCSVNLNHYGQPTWGYMVSLAGFEYRCQRMSQVEQWAEQCLCDWLATMANESLVNEYFLGVWYDSKQSLFFVDVSIQCDTLHAAARIAHENQQLAIYDCEQRTIIQTTDLIDEEGNLR